MGDAATWQLIEGSCLGALEHIGAMEVDGENLAVAHYGG